MSETPSIHGQCDPRFKAGYDFFVGQSLPIPSVMSVAIRKASLHHHQLMNALRAP